MSVFSFFLQPVAAIEQNAAVTAASSKAVNFFIKQFSFRPKTLKNDAFRHTISNYHDSIRRPIF